MKRSTPLPVFVDLAVARWQKLACFLLLLAGLAGCAPQAQEVTAAHEPLEEPVAANPRPQSPGTLWNGDEGSWLSDIKARRVGDIVTVIIREQAKASKEATTDTSRDAGISAGISTFFGLEKNVQDSTNINPSSMISANSGNEFSGKGKTTRSEDLAATLTTQVVEVYPNGNLKIRGGKSVAVNNENQIIYLTGIVRPYDVTAENTVDSGNILNAQITYTGKGALSDKQKPGWLMRIFDNTWPF
ncbi:MAG: flagellar basal body L-ring protein FlgH [Desulfobulbus sp.]|jgi:flagellar L-ring protein precursor FlgH|uniref:flagellar basal body L-ring protein FlgH n=1 Tax=Desulfobulbus sp. TaxID=895 RepID=UPI002841467A|nr:flagellar basal body L-ring protein FlgH [Desulfobulbus sp.]MDR2550747.1 flagellar basal body L-ring protein FlgH [Desulfobulbus sp.]